ncbi:restriction endonuclease [Rhizobium leguminosarum]|uniref:restriction endonuclease n=1 Tax=Rhizobium leguminosarum TaxID=384 RepID=UPI001C98D98B|nr:restriction endonuclease [Rhizobium leguminosarum]MBY5700558.1 restriction endonuclease [Rhizobium leguminosarum]
MSQNYDFKTLSPPEFEALCVELTAAELELPFETFAEGRDRGIDGRNEHDGRNIIVQAKHFRNSTWENLQKAAEDESKNLKTLNPERYIFTTSQPLTPDRKEKLKTALNHPSVSVGDIWGQTELNALLQKHPDRALDVEHRSSSHPAQQPYYCRISGDPLRYQTHDEGLRCDPRRGPGA